MKREVPEGAVVKFKHRRKVVVDEENMLLTRFEVGQLFQDFGRKTPRIHLSPTGGVTEALVTLPDGLVAQGVAECSRLDHYNKKVGRDIALGRALKLLEEA